jgi:hypothetical protein
MRSIKSTYNPFTKSMLPDGSLIDETDYYWARAIRDGQVQLMDEPQCILLRVEIEETLINTDEG